ncbi:hypothetical protein Taro_003309 [Colocasia esculenta]|uniref:Uncharacterized protein n=1 Tax=Colocasia esculenta TaxID=4460 RepID=A0A843TRF5_COLES|nr:hypothetical protein [Colocasia esculenta]
MMRMVAKAVAARGFCAAHAPWSAMRWLQVPESCGASSLYPASSDQSTSIDGWKVVVRDEDELFDALYPAPLARLVFVIPVPEEAKEATLDLKDAVLMPVEQEQKVREDARIYAEQDAATQKYVAHVLQMMAMSIESTM